MPFLLNHRSPGTSHTSYDFADSIILGAYNNGSTSVSCQGYTQRVMSLDEFWRDPRPHALASRSALQCSVTSSGNSAVPAHLRRFESL